MVRITANEKSLLFTFTNSNHYFQNGTVEVPKNSLALIVDDSDMATFKKSASNDVFISASYTELGMSKAELISWFEENGFSEGGGGLTPEETQEMIDESISGKADTSAVTEAISEAVSGKTDLSAFTAYSASVDTALSNKADVSSLTAYFDSAEYNSTGKTIEFYNNGVLKDSIDATAFIKDGMVDTVSIEDITSGGTTVNCLVITFNTDSGKENINIPIKDIFDSDLYYDKTATDGLLANKLDVSSFNTYSGGVDTALSGKASQSDLNTLSGDVIDVQTALQGKADTSDLANYVEVTAYTAYTSSTETTINGKASQTDLNTVSGNVATVSGSVANKQDLLVSGTNIKTINNTSILGSGDIEISGGGDVDPNLDINSENAVANSAITKTIQDNELVIANALIDIQDNVDTVNGKVDSKADTATVNAELSKKVSTTNFNIISAETSANTTALNGISLWKGRQERYDAITVKDPNTLYFIVDEFPNYLRFTARNGAATIGMSGTATPNVSYSMDGETWNTWDFSDISLAEDETVYLKGTNTSGFSTSSSNYKKFTMSGTVEANGSVQSLLYGDSAFEDELTIPNNNCYYAMFSGCTSLTTAPQLPATTLASDCYVRMFNGCTNLTTAPELPATTLASNCYQYMFYGCTKLNYIKAMFTTTPSGTYTSYWVYNVSSSGTFVKNINATWDVRGSDGVPTNWTIEYVL